MMLYIFSNLLKTSLTIEFKEQTQFLYKITKGHNSAKEAGGMMLYICTMFSQNIFDSFKLIQLMLKIKKGHNSARNVGKVTVLDLCTHSDNAIYL